MSVQTAMSALGRMNGRPAYLSPAYPTTDLARDLLALANADYDREIQQMPRRQTELLAAFGFGPSETQEQKSFAYSDGLAFIPVHGVLLNRYAYSWGYVTGYDFIRQQLRAASADPDVKAIVFDVNSPGGMAAGCLELSTEIAAAEKPTMAVVDAQACSAAYWLASATDKVVLTPSGHAGSIGCVVVHASYAGMLKDAGVEITFVFAGQHKVDGNPYEVLSDSVKADIQKSVDAAYGQFVAGVAANRDMTEQAVRDTEARVYDAEEALSAGLVDAVQPAGDAVMAWINELSGSDGGAENEIMTEQTQAVNPSEIISADRARINSILSCEEASGREALARHFALETDMSAEAARTALALAPKAQAPAPVAASPFENAMDRTGSPNVGAGGSPDQSGTQEPGNRLLASLANLGFDTKTVN